MKRLWIKFKAYFRPHWFSLDCPTCGQTIWARSNPHMTDAVGKHSRANHPERWQELDDWLNWRHD